MKKVLLALLLCCALFRVSAQKPDLDRVADSIQAEAQSLYRSEMASWYGTDALMARYPQKQAQLGGYISYLNDTGGGTCVFFEKGDHPKALATFKFDSSYDTSKVTADTIVRKFSKQEKELYTMRNKAKQRMYSGDTLFKAYKNTELNIIPILVNHHKRVYVLTGTQQNGVVLIGNDYLLNFDANDEITSEEKLHKGLLVLQTGGNDKNPQIISFHSHLPQYSPFITATDICTVMLYQKYTKWQQAYVMSANYVSLWDCSKKSLLILTRQAWDRISKAASASDASKQ